MKHLLAQPLSILSVALLTGLLILAYSVGRNTVQEEVARHSRHQQEAQDIELGQLREQMATLDFTTERRLALFAERLDGKCGK